MDLALAYRSTVAHNSTRQRLRAPFGASTANDRRMVDAPFPSMEFTELQNLALTWQDLQQRVREAKRVQMSQGSNGVPTTFTMRPHPDSHVDAVRVRAYFLGMPPGIGRRENTLLYTDFTLPSSEGSACNNVGLGSSDCGSGSSDPSIGGSPMRLLPWRPLLDADVGGGFSAVGGELSKEEQLLRERRRVTSLGITAYDAQPESGKFAFILAGGLLATCSDELFTAGQVPPVIPQRDSLRNRPAAKLDPKICPAAAHLVAFVCDGDLWVRNDDTGNDTRLTFARQGSADSRGCTDMFGCCASRIALDEPLSCGAPPFVVQEEFDRCTGYWWHPHELSDAAKPGVHTYHLLYEEVDESSVDVVFIPSAPPVGCAPLAMSTVSCHGTALDGFRYPRAGSKNAKCDVKVVRFSVDSSGQVVDVVHLQLVTSLQSVFPWAEYIVRLDWHPAGCGVWLQLLDRLQQRLALVLVPLDLFVSEETLKTLPSEVAQQQASRIVTLREEVSSIWINVHDGLYFLTDDTANSGSVSFIWLSEQSGFRHLYLCQASTNQNGGSKVSTESRQLTSGEWEVSSQQFWVDERRQLVFFMASMDTPLESHLYYIGYGGSGCGGADRDGAQELPLAPVRLTETGYSHAITLDVAVGVVVDTFSSLGRSSECRLSRLCFRRLHDGDSSDTCGRGSWCVSLAPVAQLLVPADAADPQICDGNNSGGCCCLDGMRCSCGGGGRSNSRRGSGGASPRLLSFSSSAGVETHCLVYEPPSIEPGRLYPAVLFVYGGPQVQLVTNSDKSLRYTRLNTIANLGYVVIMMDCRGSKGRGLAYESNLKNKMGSVEVADQVEGLHAVASKLGYVDLSRVAVHGWSYGGYLALMALAQRPDVFKVCIAGAPVTDWHLYDTGYTERYMGLPTDNESGYRAGSVLSHVSNFPDSPGRLLIIHGLIDENVHFSHTSLLLTALVKAGKPYQLQVYPAERHGIRSPEANEHFETTVLHFICQNL